MPASAGIRGPGYKKIPTSILLALVVIGACAASPAAAQLQSRECIRTTQVYNEAVANHEKVVEAANKNIDGARFLNIELANLTILLSSTGTGMPEVVAASLLAQKRKLEAEREKNRIYDEQLADANFQWQTAMRTAKDARDKACQPNSFWAWAQSLVGGATGRVQSSVNARYPRPVHLYHIDRYYVEPTADKNGYWDNTLIFSEKGVWSFSSERIPDRDGIVSVNIWGYENIRIGHVDIDHVSNSSIEFCPKVQELKIKLDNDQIQEYGCK